MKQLFALLVLASLALSGCSVGPRPDIKATVQAAIAATQSAAPGATPEATAPRVQPPYHRPSPRGDYNG